MTTMKRLLCVLLFAVTVSAQEDPVARARALAAAGERGEALRLLETRLAERPDDNDARTLYGTVLSWDGDYARARTELQRVLEADPDNADARAALANVERWSRTRTPARETSVGVEYEELAADDWLQLHAAAKLGMFVVRGSHADRGDLDDQQVEVEVYPRITPRSYAYVTGAVSADGALYPDWRLGAEYFFGFGHGFEASAGYRHLAFDEEVELFTASLGKYAGNWLFQGRTYANDGDFAWQGLARRYMGDEGAYFGLRAGTARDEIRSGLDVIALDEREFAAEALWVVRSRWTVAGRAGIATRNGDERALGAVTLGLRY
jgi:YaiO family outer membrane protein